MGSINKNLSLCKKGKHKLRINKFGVTWCVRCGLLSNTLNAEPLEEKDKFKYKIGDKVIFNSQVFIVTDVGYGITERHWYFIKGYDKGNNVCKVITEKFLKPYNE